MASILLRSCRGRGPARLPPPRAAAPMGPGDSPLGGSRRSDPARSRGHAGRGLARPCSSAPPWPAGRRGTDLPGTDTFMVLRASCRVPRPFHVASGRSRCTWSLSDPSCDTEITHNAGLLGARM
ncbi:hypothetical protein J1605_009190 [Eschrichtius robustus]|uniref:Uncharacterized protein n=1 Tax=Eschrichtius robustus TaxID=9764 RepID=A0AB34GXW8_ESCRO|nr:hypothetical protein J1605_009190 [Eschrichtius robustus]